MKHINKKTIYVILLICLSVFLLPDDVFARPDLTPNGGRWSWNAVALANGTVGTPYSETITASDCSTTYFWSIANGSLPNGLSISASGPQNSILTISGTPTTAETQVFRIRVSSSSCNGSGTVRRRWYEITIDPSTSLDITTLSLPNGDTCTSYSETITAQNGSTPYNWAVTSGALPTGLTLAPTGTPSTTLSGTPTTTGPYNFTVTVTDSLLNTDSQDYTVDITSSILILTGSSLPSGTEGVSYTTSIDGDCGNTSSYSWSVITGVLPPGLTLGAAGDPTTISGVPTAAGTYPFTIFLEDGATSTQKDFTITIAMSNLVIDTTDLVPDTVAICGIYSASITASGGNQPYSWAVSSGILPPGISLSPSGTLPTGSPTTVSGVPTANGTYSFDVKVTDNTSVSRTVSLSIQVTGSASSCDPDILDYTAYPPFVQLSGVKPNVLIMLDNSGSMYEFAYKTPGDGGSRGITSSDSSFDPNYSYYGYFKSKTDNNGVPVMYSYSGSYFEEDAAGTWNGDFLNWLTMRRVDVMRKILVGGKANPRSQVQINYLQGTEDPDRDYWKLIIGSPNQYYRVYGGTSYGIFRVCTDSSSGNCSTGDGPVYNIRVKYSNAPVEPEGLIHENANRMRFGLMFFQNNGAKFEDGGGVQDGSYVALQMGTTATSMITQIENEDPDTWTPLGESAYEALRFYQNGDKAYSGGNYGAAFDPLDEYCQDNFILYLTDGESTKDQNVPGGAWGSPIADNNSPAFSVKTYLDMIATNEGYASQWAVPANNSDGTYYLEGVSYYIHTNDIRDDLTDDQTVTTYTVFAFDDSAVGRELLQKASKYGGFNDTDGDGKPYTNASCFTTTPDSLCAEWDADNDFVPDTYYEAQEGNALKREIGQALEDILKRTSSGTSASVLATTGEGEGTVYQAYFVPSKNDNSGNEVKWVGYLHGLFIDKWGHMREDSFDASSGETSGDKKLCYGAGDPDANCTGPDTIVQMYFDETVSPNRTRVRRYPGTIDPDTHLPTGSYTTIEFDQMQTLWEGGRKLFNTSPANRTIYTTTNGFDFLSGNFTESNASSLRPYLRAGTDDEAEAIIKYIRGEDDPVVNSVTYDYRPRTFTIGADTEVWKLSDIVYSTPMTVSKPAEDYSLIYKDATYASFQTKYKLRRHTIYVGANDGMLHAFNGGFYDPIKMKFCNAYMTEDPSADPPVLPGTCGDSDTGSTLGNELWGFIPQSLLPHLKWLTQNDYTHVYYVDLHPKIVDARIFASEFAIPDGKHPYGWGTILIGGMRYGGRDIEYGDPAFSGSGSRTFRSAYFAIDITDPLSPDLLWTIPNTSGSNETGLPDLGLTTSRPAVLRVGDDVSLPGTWYAVFGSGPDANTDINSTGITDSYEGLSDRLGSIYIVNLATGALITNFDLPDSNSFVADPATVDVSLTDKVDAIYVGSTFCQSSPDCTSSQWKGKMHRITTNIGDSNTDNWSLATLYDAGQSITAAPTLALDDRGNLWIYFGTGRYYALADSFLDGSENWTFYGLKDNCQSWYSVGGSGCTTPIDVTDLLDATSMAVFTDETVTGGGSITNFTELLDEINTTSNDGWVLNFAAGERSLYKPAVLGGIVSWTTYTPGASDVCELGGTSRLYASFYKTGTAYKTSVIGYEGTGPVYEVKRSTDLGKGVPSSVGFSVTGEKSAQGFVQQSTGAIIQLEETTPFVIKSKVTGWRTGN